MEQQAAVRRPRLCVLTPTPLLMVEIEPGDDDAEHSADLHLHPGGQGLWVARMAISLGAAVTVCGPFGGEVGAVLAHMLSEEKLTVRAVPYNAGNGAYVHDRRSGDRQTLAHMVPPQLTRHELDDLYGTVLVEALESDVLVLTGAEPERVLPASFFSRLVRDVRSVDKPIVADLSGQPAKAAAAEGPTVLKMSHEELQAAGLTEGDSVEELQQAGHRLVAQGVAVALGRGASVVEAARLGAAAGALNVTRRGLGTGRREQIERFAGRIR